MTLWVLTPAGHPATTVQCPDCHRARLRLETGPVVCPECGGQWLLVINPAAGNDRARIDRVDILPASNSVLP